MTAIHQPRLLPYGIGDLDPALQIDPGPPMRIRCVVNGCGHYLIPPTRSGGGEVCPEHRIRVHKSGTYSCADVRDNIIVAKQLLATRMQHHKFKFESRFHLEKSEDALTWNTFRSFLEAGSLKVIASFLTGLNVTAEPRLFLWGIEQNDALQPLDLLIAARRRFESRLPVERPATEPDAMLLQPGQFVVLIEAKLCSPNPFYTDGARKDDQSLTKAELLDIYADPTLHMIDREKSRQAGRVWPQLHRNVTFSEWMANAIGGGTRAYFANLTRRGHELDSFGEFAQVIRPSFAGRISHCFWEDLWVLAGISGGRLAVLQEYLLCKTANLQPALNMGYW